MGSRFDDCPNLRLGAIAGVGPAGRRTGKAERAAKYRRQRGRFLLLHRLCLPATRTMAVRLPAAALGGAWPPGKPRGWDGMADLILMPLPKMDDCPVRWQPDLAGCAALGLEIGRGATIRQHLAAGPSVAGKRYAGWHLRSEWRRENANI